MGCLGVDPDTQGTGYALVHEGKLVRAWVCCNTAKAKGRDCAAHQARELACRLVGLSSILNGKVDRIVVEGQQVYQGNKVSANKILTLTLSAGSVLGLLSTRYLDAKVLVPLPGAWKGQIPKNVHHARLEKKFPEWRSKVEGEVPRGREKEILDAIGLAAWGDR